MVPVLATRYPAGGAVASATSDSISEIDERSALNSDSDSARFNPWVGDDSGAGQQQQQYRRMPQRELNSALLENSSESFVSAFASDINMTEMKGAFNRRVTQAALTHGIGSYVNTAAVIHDDVPSLGDNLSLKL
jgi:hypothetical protein